MYGFHVFPQRVAGYLNGKIGFLGENPVGLPQDDLFDGNLRQAAACERVARIARA